MTSPLAILSVRRANGPTFTLGDRRRHQSAGMDQARRQFRRVNGYLHLPALRVALDQTIATAVTPTKEDAA